MAISDHLPGVEVTVTVDSNDLKEYVDDEPGNRVRTTTRYIEAQTGQTFAIRMKVDEGFTFVAGALEFVIEIDGYFMDVCHISKDDCFVGENDRKTVSEGVTKGGGRLHRYQFNSIETVSDGHMLHREAALLKDIGTIVVRVDHVTFKKPAPKPRPKPAPKSSTVSKPKKATITEEATTKEIDFVSEKAVKGRAISHSVRLVEEKAEKQVTQRQTDRRADAGTIPTARSKQRQSQPLKQHWDTYYASGCPSPAAVFVFKYRSLDALKSLLIISRTPPPLPLEERDANDLTIEELRELHRRSQVAKKEQMKIKREEQEAEPKRRKIARPTAKSTQLTIDEEGEVREEAPTGASQSEVIELD